MQLEQIQNLYDEGRYVDAYVASKELGDLKTWRSRSGRILAGRLAGNVGSYRLMRLFHRLAFRENPEDTECLVFHLADCIGYSDALIGWKTLRCWKERPSDPANVVVHLNTLKARLACFFRDFAASEHYLKQAERVCADDPWIFVERAYVNEKQDLLDKALESVQHALHLKPYYRSALIGEAHFLQMMGRKQEASEVLRTGLERIQSGHFALKLAEFLEEDLKYDDALRMIERAEILMPLADKSNRELMMGTRIRIACLQNDFHTLKELTPKIKKPYYKQLNERIYKEQTFKRKMLEVSFIHQRHNTCAPATIAMLAQYWKRPVDQMVIADEICFDGTPRFKEWRWLEDNGWIVSEFTATWDLCVQLIDRGVPFSITTNDTMNSHAQAIIGYDELRETLIIRDPSYYSIREVSAKLFLENYLPFGPPGMIVIPREEETRLKDLILNDAPIRRQLYQIQLALERYDRIEAARIFAGMNEIDPEHIIALATRRTLAIYDGDPTAHLDCIEAYIRRFPKNSHMISAYLHLLSQVGRAKDKMRFIETISRDESIDPALYIQFAQAFANDPEQVLNYNYWRHQTSRFCSVIPEAIALHADMLWEKLFFEEAFELYRYASLTSDNRNFFQDSYRMAAIHLNKTDDVISYLKEQFQTLGDKTPEPAIALCDTLRTLDRIHETFKILDEALLRRPNDGALLLYAADNLMFLSEYSKAEERLLEAKPHVKEIEWLPYFARLQAQKGDRPAAIGAYRTIIEIQPLNVNLHRDIALLLAETEGPNEAISHIERFCDRFPYHIPLHSLWLDWIDIETSEKVEPNLKRLLQLHPANVYLHCMLAKVLAFRKRFDEAIRELDLAANAQSLSMLTFSTRAIILEMAGDFESLRTVCLEALRISIDNQNLISLLMKYSMDIAQKKESIRFLETEIMRQTIRGDCVHSFRHAARGVLEPGELREALNKIYEARPDIWESYSALAIYLADTDCIKEALEVAEIATRQFPLLPRTWLDLAYVQRLNLNPQAELTTLEHTLKLNPAWSTAAAELSDYHRRNGDVEKALAVLKSICTLAPLDSRNHVLLAETLFEAGNKREAIERVERALEIDSDSESAWNYLRYLSGEIGDPDHAIRLARKQTETRGGLARSWLNLAKLLEDSEIGEKMACIDRAIQLDKLSIEAYELKAILLADSGDFPGALKCCHPPVFRHRPLQLRMREASIEHSRMNMPKAFKLLKQTLEDHPDYAPGWQELATWHWDSGHYDEAVAAAEKLGSLDPFNGIVFGFIGTLKEEKKDLAGAICAYRRASMLDPDYEYTVLRLVHLLIEQSDLPEAEKILEKNSQKMDRPGFLLRQAELLAKKKNFEKMTPLFEKICFIEHDSSAPIEKIAQILDQNHLKFIVNRTISLALKNRQISQACIQFWIKRNITAAYYKLYRRINSLVKQDARLGKCAVIAYLSEIGELIQNRRKSNHAFIAFPEMLAMRMLKKHRKCLSEDTQGWGIAGYIYGVMNKRRQLIEWMKNWRNYKGLQPWMLFNLSSAYMKLGMEKEAFKVIDFAVRMPGADHTLDRLRSFAALRNAISGREASARELLNAIPDPTNMEPHDKSLADLARAILAIQESNLSPTCFDLDLKKNLKICINAFRDNQVVRSMLLRSAKIFSAKSGNNTPYFWTWFIILKARFKGLSLFGFILLIYLIYFFLVKIMN